MDEPVEGPEFEVWNHLESGWQMAYDDMARQIDRQTMENFESIAAIVVRGGAALHLDSGMKPIRQQLETFLPGLSSSQYEAVFMAVATAFREGTNPWLSHAVELELARDGIGRATSAFARFKLLTPQLNQRPLPDKAEKYLAEAVQTFLFGFDPACIALCRSALEQVARDVLVKLGALTAPQIDREKPTLEAMLLKLRQAGALTTGYDAADRVRDRGNTVLHNHLYDNRARKQVALDSLLDLATVLRNVLP